MVQKKAGRKPTNKTSKSVHLTIRVTKEQRDKLKALAEEKGLNVSELVLSKFKMK